MPARPHVAETRISQTYTVATNNIFRFRIPAATVLMDVRVQVGTGPSGGTALFDLDIEGTSIWDADPAQRITIPDAGTEHERTGVVVVGADGDEVAIHFEGFTGAATSVGGPVEITVKMYETGATATDAELRDCATHTGILPIASIDERAIRYTSVALTNAQILALRATPITVIAAPGAGKFIEFVSGILIFNRTAAYTETADNLRLRYVNGSGSFASQEIEATGFVDAAGNAIINILPNAINSIITAGGELSNALICIHNVGGDEFGGGDAANTITVSVAYRVHSTGL